MADANQKILIVDDEPTNISVTVEAFSGEAYKLLVANNGRLALQLALVQQPDIILLDWEMPVMDGFETLQKLKESNKTSWIPVIIVTGVKTTYEHLHKALEAGANDLLKKPFDKLELLLKVRSMLALSGSLKEIIALRNAELASITAQLVHQNEFVNDLSERIGKINILAGVDCQRAHAELGELLSRIKSHEKLIDWDSFQRHFMELNPDFLKDLARKHPGLTPSEIKLCMLLRLNLNTKELAAFLNQTNESVKVFRARLRKKLGIGGADNLVGYLMTF